MYESALAASNENVQSFIHKNWIAKVNYLIIFWWYHDDFDKLYDSDLSFLLHNLLLNNIMSLIIGAKVELKDNIADAP